MASNPPSDSTEEREYILGTDREERDRLHTQHQTWRQQSYSLWERAGIRTGHVVLDLGCGPGATTLDLAELVGPTGRVLAVDKSERFLAALREDLVARRITQVETQQAAVEDLALEPESLDAAYTRWLLCWLQDPGAVLRTVAQALKPGAYFALQEYLDWGAMKLVPRNEVFDEVILACMRSWEAGGATIDFCDRLPDLAEAAGLELTLFEPVARLGPVGSLEWRWLGEFFRSYLPRLVASDQISASLHEAFLAEWDERTRAARGYCTTPTLANVLLRKP